ncbi:MAG: ISAs1 family transposase [Phaeodactylibacter sp.]|nr:ISAs1 family transposase [Phaeodactylibacter sp.]
MEQEKKAPKSLTKHFSSIPDPRKPQGLLHSLEAIFTIAILAVICGADEWTEIEEFGKSKQEFLEGLLELRHGIPSHDTFGRVFSMIDAEAFAACFISWVSSLCEINGEIVNIDGKQLRHSFDTHSEKAAIHMVSAWANANEMVLGQAKVDEKSNEITAIPKLLDILDLAGSVVTIDAMGTQKEIAEKIVGNEADYVLALKGNQGELHDEVIEAFQRYSAKKKGEHSRQSSLGHGRIEERNCYVAPAAEFLSPNVLKRWKGLQAIVKIEAYVEYKNGKRQGEQVYEERYYISSLGLDAERMNEVVRSHWGIETKLHWVLDIAFREDDSRIRKGNASENFATLRHIAINKLKNEKSLKRGIKAKRKKAGWDNDYLIKVLAA